MVGVMMRAIIYSKPSINNLKGKHGKRIIDTIRNTPKSSHEQLQIDAEACMKRIQAKRTNG